MSGADTSSNIISMSDRKSGAEISDGITSSIHAVDGSVALTHIPFLDVKVLHEEYVNAKNRLFLFDYDGTLTPIVQNPAAAILSDRMIQTLQLLTKDPKNHIWIISGRDQAFLEQWLGQIEGLGLSAEHGSFIRDPETHNWENLAAEKDMSWQPSAQDIMQTFAVETPGSWIEKKKVAITWHYRNTDPDLGAAQAFKCEQKLKEELIKKWEVNVITGKKVVEVRPHLLDKGAMALKLWKRYDSDTDARLDFMLCLGDDQTDEDMFRVLQDWKDIVFACKIGPGENSFAKYQLSKPADVEDLLASLVMEDSV